MVATLGHKSGVGVTGVTKVETQVLLVGTTPTRIKSPSHKVPKVVEIYADVADVWVGGADVTTSGAKRGRFVPVGSGFIIEGNAEAYAVANATTEVLLVMGL